MFIMNCVFNVTGSANGQLSCQVWDDFLKYLGCPVGGAEVKEAKEGEQPQAKVFPSVPHVSIVSHIGKLENTFS